MVHGITVSRAKSRYFRSLSTETPSARAKRSNCWIVMFFLPFSIALMYPLSISSARQMSPCDIPLRPLIFFMLSPSLLLINIIIAYEILHFQTILYYNSSGSGEAKPKISFPFFVGSPPHPTEENKKGKENFWFLLPRPKGADEARRLVRLLFEKGSSKAE